jgi:hypothetical protein
MESLWWHQSLDNRPIPTPTRSLSILVSSLVSTPDSSLASSHPNLLANILNLPASNLHSSLDSNLLNSNSNRLNLLSSLSRFQEVSLPNSLLSRLQVVSNLPSSLLSRFQEVSSLLNSLLSSLLLDNLKEDNLNLETHLNLPHRIHR